MLYYNVHVMLCRVLRFFNFLLTSKALNFYSVNHVTSPVLKPDMAVKFGIFLKFLCSISSLYFMPPVAILGSVFLRPSA